MRAIASAVPVPADYRNFHFWMLIPFGITILGFSYSYYQNLGKATFHQHVHGIWRRCGTSWCWCSPG